MNFRSIIVWGLLVFIANTSWGSQDVHNQHTFRTYVHWIQDINTQVRNMHLLSSREIIALRATARDLLASFDKASDFLKNDVRNKGYSVDIIAEFRAILSDAVRQLESEVSEQQFETDHDNLSEEDRSSQNEFDSDTTEPDSASESDESDDTEIEQAEYIVE